MTSQRSNIGQSLPSRLKLRSRGGCTNCKLRKRKCNEGKPLCEHCKKMGYRCRYPDRSSDPEQQESVSQLQRQRMKMPIGFAAPSDRQPSPGFESVPSFIVANHEDIRISFLLHNAFKGANAANQAGIAGSSLTVQTELEFAHNDTSLTYNCLRGMAMIYWGAVNKNQAVLSQGYNVRGKSLVNLRHALTSKIDAASGDLVAAVALTRLSDTILPKAGSQWMIHTEALTHLCRAIGPAGFQEPRLLRLLENNRWVMIAASSLKRTPTIFNEDPWKTTPWQNSEKDVVQTLLDVYAGLPNLRFLFDKMHRLLKDEASRLSGCAEFHAALANTMAELHQWRASVDSEITGSVTEWKYSPRLTTIVPLEPDQPQLSFQQLHHSYAVILFNTLVIILSQYLEMSSITPQQFEAMGKKPKKSAGLLTTLDLPLRNPLQRAAVAADEIARIVPWLMQDRHKCAGALYIAGPAVVADQFWQRSNQSKSIWFATVVSQINGLWESYVIRSPDREGELLKVLV